MVELNNKKTVVIFVSQNNERQQINIFINKNKLKQRDQFKSLGTLISRDRCNNTSIASKIVQVKKVSRE